MPSNPAEISDLINQITVDVKGIVADEVALAKAEIKPAIRRVGVGSGLFGAAGYIILSTTIICWFVFAAGFAWLWASVTPLSGWGCAFFGVLTAMVAMLILAGVLILIGKRSFAAIKGPKRTPATVSEAIAAILSGLAEGRQRVKTELMSS